MEPDRDPFGLEKVQDFRDIGLDMWRGVIIKKEEKVEEEAPDLGREFFILDLGQPVIQFV
jgi:hypothetical protein